MKVNDASKIFQEVVLEIELGNWLELHLFKFFIKYGLIQFSIMGYYFPLKTQKCLRIKEYPLGQTS